MQPPELDILIQEKLFNFSIILARKRLINGKILKICLEEYIFLKSPSFKEHFDVFFSLSKIKLQKFKNFNPTFLHHKQNIFAYIYDVFTKQLILFICAKNQMKIFHQTKVLSISNISVKTFGMDFSCRSFITRPRLPPKQCKWPY